jgi:hypothetical protein
MEAQSFRQALSTANSKEFAMPKPKMKLVSDDAKPATPADYEAECLQGRVLAAALITEMAESGKTSAGRVVGKHKQP